MALAAGIAFLMVVLSLLTISLWNLHHTPKIDPAVAREKSYSRKTTAWRVIESTAKEERSAPISRMWPSNDPIASGI